jgi:hypothetical protein
MAFAAATIAVVRTGGYRAPRGVRLLALQPWQFVVVQHAARRIAASDRKGDPAIVTPDAAGVAEFMDVWIARLPPRMQRDLGRFLAYLEHVAPLAAGHTTRFTRLAAEDQDAVLAGTEASAHDLLRAGFEGLKALVFMGYYRDARTWPVVGYDGPLVGRPAGGWQ